MPVRLAEAAVRDAAESDDKATILNTLGGALHRAGRYGGAIRRLEEAIQAQGGEGLFDDWALLAMAHHRRGHRDEARRRLGQLRDHQPSGSPTQFDVDRSARLLRSEAEAVILYDPAFPDDPFAH